MITYELALKLKEAGFPQPEEHKDGHYDSWILQNTHGKAYYKPLNGEIITQILFPGMCYAREAVYIPTLSELIEACEGALESLENKIDRKSMERVWKAWGIEMEPWNPASNQMGQGISPEEAVANLYLSLHK